MKQKTSIVKTQLQLKFHIHWRRFGKGQTQTWGSRVRTIWALENLSVKRIMKQPSASSQWKLPWWVPTRFRGIESEGEGEAGEREARGEEAMKVRRKKKLGKERNWPRLNPKPLQRVTMSNENVEHLMRFCVWGLVFWASLWTLKFDYGISKRRVDLNSIVGFLPLSNA